MPVDVEARRRLTAALLGAEAALPPDQLTDRAARGRLIGVSEQTLHLATPAGEESFPFTGTTSFWRGGDAAPNELHPGDDVVLRYAADGSRVAEQVWAQMARVTGVISSSHEETVQVDIGHDRPSATVVIPYRVSGRMRVRHPVLEPGYLFDAIGVWRDGEVHAVLPATTQPPYSVRQAPRRPLAYERRSQVSGMVSWYDPALGHATDVNPLARLVGAAYPALDSASDCGDGCERRQSCLPLPLMSLGTTFSLRNDYTGDTAVLPIVACGAASAHFCDRCAAGAPGERGRLAQLTLLSFVGLGGTPTAGCFNATMRVG
ncbi:hypothetical protein [Allosalinactinospora lopnorensis]|uniref:hypothetical protein n=1 Tax=Allosalinactinospora lopnorensis TaxID=1352348 RepID=UPI000623F1E9|nr:hypothetical protein [Allosalinactinospora lopnorensis]